MLSIIKGQFAGKQRGASLIGYALVVGLISVVALVALDNSGAQVNGLFGTVSDKLEDSNLQVALPSPQPSDAPPVTVSLDSPILSFSEDAAPGPAGHEIGAISVADDGLSSVSLSVDDSANFFILGNTLYLDPPAGLDFETASSYSVTIIATDGAGATSSVPYTVTILDNGTFTSSTSTFNFATCSFARDNSGSHQDTNATLSGNSSGFTGSASNGWQGVMGLKCPFTIGPDVTRITIDWAAGTMSYNNSSGSGGGSCFQVYDGDPDPLAAGHNVIDWPNNCTTSGGPLYSQYQSKSSGSTSASFSVVSELIDVSSLSDGFTMYFSFADAWAGGVGISYNFGALTITEDVPD